MKFYASITIFMVAMTSFLSCKHGEDLTRSRTKGISTEEKNQKAFLETVAYMVGTSGNYNVLFSGETFSDTKDHPRKKTTKNGISTDAAGKYMIRAIDYDNHKSYVKVTDFRAESQDRIATDMLYFRGALKHIKQIKNYTYSFSLALNKARQNPAWTSYIPYSNPEKPTTEINNLFAKFKEYRSKVGAAKKPDVAPAKDLKANPLNATAKELAFLEMISDAVGSKGDYNIIWGSKNFTDTSDHPRVAISESDAAGKYQIKSKDFDKYKISAGVTDFSKSSQDKVAYQMLIASGATKWIDKISTSTYSFAMALSAANTMGSWSIYLPKTNPNSATSKVNDLFKILHLLRIVLPRTRKLSVQGMTAHLLEFSYV
jgi:muramidase (phage lysozyme)